MAIRLSRTFQLRALGIAAAMATGIGGYQLSLVLIDEYTARQVAEMQAAAERYRTMESEKVALEKALQGQRSGDEKLEAMVIAVSEMRRQAEREGLQRTSR
jgi:lactam utilization protein B